MYDIKNGAAVGRAFGEAGSRARHFGRQNSEEECRPGADQTQARGGRGKSRREDGGDCGGEHDRHLRDRQTAALQAVGVRVLGVPEPAELFEMDGERVPRIVPLPEGRPEAHDRAQRQLLEGVQELRHRDADHAGRHVWRRNGELGKHARRADAALVLQARRARAGAARQHGPPRVCSRETSALGRREGERRVRPAAAPRVEVVAEGRPVSRDAARLHRAVRARLPAHDQGLAPDRL